MSKLLHAALSLFNIRRSDSHYRWYHYHHI
jgi:hypothetical protein